MDKAPLQSFADAEKTCAAAADGAKLISIHSPDEQSFFNNFLYTKKHVVDNLWLSGHLVTGGSNVFQWKDDSNLTFTNWASGNPKNNPSDICVQMQAEEELRGKWSNEPCTKKNLVVCEKKQTWSNAKMQEIIETMLRNPVPLGFIYVQLPKENSPLEIWPWMSWTDISPSFNGVFFRVASGNAASFGTVQEDFSPYIDEIKHNFGSSINPSSSETDDAKISRNGGWTGDVLAAVLKEGSGSYYHGYLNFHTATGEVRPRNMAVKVWKRTG